MLLQHSNTILILKTNLKTRAPEVLLRSTNYSSPIDLWAVGCVLAELYRLTPLFPGKSEVDQLFKICAQLGTPDEQRDREIVNLAKQLNFKFPQFSSQPIEIENTRLEALNLITQLLSWNPLRRPNASASLKHNYFKNVQQQTTNYHNHHSKNPNHSLSSSRSQQISKFNDNKSNNYQSNKVNEMVNSMSVSNNLDNSFECK